jgi:hypothetical protein
MGMTNLDKVRQRMEEAKAEAERRKAKFWKLKEGRNVVRILPPWEGADEFYKPYGQHFKIGLEGKTIVYCPNDTLGLPCPVCDGIKAMWKGADAAGDEELKKRLKDISSTPRFMVNLIDRKEPEKGIQQGDIPKSVMESIWNKMVDPDAGVGDITDPKAGYDVIIVRRGEGINTKYDVSIATKPSVVDPGVLEGIVDLDALIKVESYENLKLIVDGKEAPAVTSGSAKAALPPPADVVDAEFKESAPVPAGPPPCFGSFSDDNAKCLDCPEQDDCETKMIEQKRAARKAGKAAVAAAGPAGPAPVATADDDISADDLMAEINEAIRK